MKLNIKDLDFHLFDGEGASDGGGLGPEASAFMDSISKDAPQRKQESKSDLSQVKYGRSKDDGSAGQVGSDNAPDLGAEFAELISKDGRYYDVYRQAESEAIQRAVKQRFKNQADLQGQVDQMNEALSPLYQNYGLKLGDVEGLSKALAGDEAIYTSGAERAGLSVEQYKQNLRLQAEAERGRQITEAYEAQQRQNAMFAQWESDAAQLQEVFPNFDLGLEIQHNEQFAKLLDTGVDVATAFASTHLMELLHGSNETAAKQATQNVVNSIQQRSSRPAEGAMSHAPAIQRKSDPSALTNDDMDEIMRRVQEGESFAF